MKIKLNHSSQVPPDKSSQNTWALWQLGFRPCFLVANLYAIVVMVVWLAIQQGFNIGNLYGYGANYWHAHELIFAYTLMVVAGFLLTAIKNWTGIQTAQGGGLQLLIAAWVIARILILIPNVPAWVVAVTDMIFPLMLIWFVSKPLVEVGNKRNYMMIVIVSVLAMLNGLFHYAGMHGQSILLTKSLLLGMLLILLLITVMAGRVFPMFSQNGVAQRYQAKVFSSIEMILPFSFIAFALVWVFWSQYSWLLFMLSILNAMLHGWRLFGWYNSQIWQKPLVWILHVGYGFLVVGFVFVAALTFFPWAYFIAIHVFTVGCIAMITMGMMARVSFGHTGRDLHHPPLILWYCFILLGMSGLSRVVLPLMSVFDYAQIILLSGGLWIMAFGLFSWSYLPVWLRPRIDGKPG